MLNAAYLAGAVALAYLLGSIPFGVLLAKRKGIDVMRAGSGNIGATNVARTAGRRLGAVALVLDAGKGAAPFALALYGPFTALSTEAGIVAMGLAPILGHCFSPWLGFRGGKGVATSLGVVLVADPLIAGLAVVAFIVVYLLARIVSVASISAATAVPVLFWRLLDVRAFTVLTTCMAVIIVVQHRDNLRRLRRGNELPL